MSYLQGFQLSAFCVAAVGVGTVFNGCRVDSCGTINSLVPAETRKHTGLGAKKGGNIEGIPFSMSQLDIFLYPRLVAVELVSLRYLTNRPNRQKCKSLLGSLLAKNISFLVKDKQFFGKKTKVYSSVGPVC